MTSLIKNPHPPGKKFFFECNLLDWPICLSRSTALQRNRRWSQGVGKATENCCFLGRNRSTNIPQAGSRVKKNRWVVFFFKKTGFSQPCFPHIQHIEYFSDGCTGHYKAYKNFPHLTYHKQDFSIDASQLFFATSHGKSSCDDIGGIVK